MAILLLGTLIFFAAQASFQHLQDNDLREESDTLAREFASGGQARLEQALELREKSPNNPYMYALFDGPARVQGNLDAARPPLGIQEFPFIDPVEGNDKAMGLSIRLPDDSELVVAVDPEGLERFDKIMLTLFSGAFVLVAALGIAGSLALGRHLKQRLERISETAAAIASGDLSRRIEVSGMADEFDRADAALNAIFDRLTALLENLQQISSDVAHDLRTPLSRLRAEIEAGLDGPGDPARLRVTLKRTLEHSNSILSLFNGILRIAEVESQDGRGNQRCIDLSRLVASVCEMHAPALKDTGHNFEWSTARKMAIFGDEGLVMQALSNLLDNAQSHTPPNTFVCVELYESDEGPCIRVADSGPGIPEKDRDRVIRRFVRLDPSRSRKGHGLGLNLVAAIMRVHGGSLNLTDNFPGLAVILAFPRPEPPSPTPGTPGS